jgi:hypothetical protein
VRSDQKPPGDRATIAVERAAARDGTKPLLRGREQLVARGQLLEATPKRGPQRSKGGGSSGSKREPLLDAPPTLADLGIDKKLSARSRKLAKLDDNGFEAAVSIAREVAGESAPQHRVIPNRGYFNSEEILATEQAGDVPLVPKPQTSNNKAQGLYDKRDFVYVEEDDEYRCPAGERAIYRLTCVENGLALRRYWSSARPNCLQKSKCTTGKNRRISRWEHEAVLERMQSHLDQRPDCARERRQTVEHPFGTQGVDGCHTFPDQDATEGANRDELACACVQHKADDCSIRNRSPDRYDAGVKLVSPIMN